MNKILNILRHILYIIVLTLLIIFNIKYGINLKIIFLYISLIILFIINIRDIKYKRKVSNKFNILFSLVMIIVIFLLSRVFFDKSLIINNNIIINKLEINNTINVIYSYKEYAINYLSQNIYFILIMNLCLILYRLIEKKDKINYKYSNTSIICLIINIILSLETIVLLEKKFNLNQFPLLFFALNTILLIVEISNLVHNNKIKKELLIYISFLFNLFAYISIFT